MVAPRHLAAKDRQMRPLLRRMGGRSCDAQPLAPKPRRLSSRRERCGSEAAWRRLQFAIAEIRASATAASAPDLWTKRRAIPWRPAAHKGDMAAPYVPLRIFSCYTMLEGAIEPKAIAKHARKLDFPPRR
jgi:hypothetical protein